MYLKYPALIIKIKDMFKGQYGRYIVSLIDYKECFSSASTLEEAFKNANENVNFYYCMGKKEKHHLIFIH